MRWINPDKLQTLNGRAYRKGGGKGDGGSSKSIDPRIVEMAQKGTFKPFTISTSIGSGFGREGESGVTASSPYQSIQSQALGGVSNLLPSLTANLQRSAQPFEFNTNVDQLTQDYYNQQAALLEPQFAQQRALLAQDLFGSGRLGLQIAGQGAGIGTGMVNPDALGLASAQSRTLAELAAGARQQALADAQARYGIESGVYGLNQQAAAQGLQNLGGLFGLGTGVSELELALLNQGLAAEQMRGASYANAAGALAAGQVQEQDSGGKGLIGDLANAGATAYAASDERLKENIEFIFKDENDINWYTWEWSSKAKELGLGSKFNYGVIAQEVMQIIPEAVRLAANGYYEVDYLKVEDYGTV